MIEIIGDAGTPEHDAALQIRDSFIRIWPGIDTTPDTDDDIKIISRAKLSGQKVSDVDVVVVALITGRRYIVSKSNAKDSDGKSLTGAKVRVKSFVAAIEVKDHDAKGVEISAGGVSVKYGGVLKSATDQNEDQRYSLLGYLQDAARGSPWVHRCVILRGIEELPRERGVTQPTSGAVGANFDAAQLLVASILTSEVRLHHGEYSVWSGNEETLLRVLKCPFMKKLQPSELDRKRMDRIAARPAEAKEIASTLGIERTHIRGNGGTGKTILLLQSAYEAYKEKSTRSLVLTYNTALAADIQRTLGLMGIPGDSEAGGITVRTVMSFVYSWLRQLNLLDQEEEDFQGYKEKCSNALGYISQGAITDAEIEAIKKKGFGEFSFDAILIDEAQDWPQEEADLLARLYGPNKIALADGLSQLIRGAATNWQGQAQASGSSAKNLRDGLRMKTSLCRFANAMAEEAGFQWHVTPNKLAPGGRVIVALGNYASMDRLQLDIQSAAIRAGNMPVDLLHCVPPSSVSEVEGRRSSQLGDSFRSKNWEVWDGVDEPTRRTFPYSRESLRVVQYESCRGLEGWSAVLDGLDEFWEYKRASTLAELKSAGIFDPETQAESIAWRWTMIPLTRPIDTLVITLRDKNSVVGKAILAASRAIEDVVEFQNY
jgi:hypothetical protein